MKNLIKKNWGLVILLCFTLAWLGYRFNSYYQFKQLYNSPKAGDIYIFEYEKGSYSPCYLDIVKKDSLYFFNHQFDYSGGIPKLSEILEDSFHNELHYIYDRAAVNEFYENEKLIKIYRTCQ